VVGSGFKKIDKREMKISLGDVLSLSSGKVFVSAGEMPGGEGADDRELTTKD
jgi:hypothetical protein